MILGDWINRNTAEESAFIEKERFQLKDAENLF
jgi:hypothetical protein